MTTRRFNEYLLWNEEKREVQLDIPQLLRKLNLPDTPETREQATKVAMKVFKEMYPDVTQDVHTMDYGTKRVYNPTRKAG